jgi:aromatic aminotransferase
VGPSGADGIPDMCWLEQQLQADPSIRMVTLTNPCNPTGVLLNRSIVQRAVELCRQYNAWLVLDCTYEYFSYDGPCFDGCFTDPHVIHIFSLSKAYALAGYRCGYMTMSKLADPLYRQVMKVQGESCSVALALVHMMHVCSTQYGLLYSDTIPICPSRISQIAALGSLQAGRDWVREKVATLGFGRSAVMKALAPCEQIMGDSGAMYLMCKVGGDDKEFARLLVRHYGVAVIPGLFCGYPGWLRICYANLPPDKCLEVSDAGESTSR